MNGDFSTTGQFLGYSEETQLPKAFLYKDRRNLNAFARPKGRGFQPSEYDNKFITREELKGYAKTLKLNYENVIGYLLNNGYVIRILRGIFYVRSIEEKKKNSINISFYEAIATALKIKKVNKWYFGLESAIKLNNLTHEYFTVDHIISGKLKRPKPIKILGHKVKFMRIKKKLLNFGIKKGKIPYSDAEKTILDFVYFGFYNNLSESEIKNKVGEYISNCDIKKLREYSRYYPKTALNFIEKSRMHAAEKSA